MVDVEQLKKEEIEELTKPVTLEALILEGVETKVPVTVDFPTKDGIVPVTCIIRPLTSSEWENATNYAMKNKKDFILKILEKGVLNDDGEPLGFELLSKMPMGVVTELYKYIADISGVKENKEEQYKLTRELMGF